MSLITFLRLAAVTALNEARRLRTEDTTRQRLIRQEGSLRATLGSGLVADATSTIGANSHIGKGVQLYDSQLQQSTRVEDRSMLICTTMEAFSKIGSDVTTHFCQIGSYTYLTGGSVVINTRIGRFCSIAHGLGVGLGMHPTHMLSSSPVFYSPGKQSGVTFAPEGSDFVEQAQSTIGNDVWLGANVFIRDGVTIGDGAIVAAGSIVVKDVEPYSIVGGVPAHEIRKRFDEESIAILLELQWWNWPENVLRKAKPLIQAGDAKALEQWFNEAGGTAFSPASVLQYA